MFCSIPVQQHALTCVVSQVLKRDGTVTAAPNFSASGDAALLDKAIKVKGEPEDGCGTALEHV